LIVTNKLLTFKQQQNGRKKPLDVPKEFFQAIESREKFKVFFQDLYKQEVKEML
jgi:hypothetical protein